MRHALGHPQHGYYMRSADIFGAKGDFVTSPEISQMFGELVAVWFAYVLQQQGASSFRLVELGPGRGTLLADALRTFASLPPTRASLQHVHLIETSRTLRRVQASALRVEGLQSVSLADEGLDAKTTTLSASAPASGTLSFAGRSVGVAWGDRLTDVPTDMPCCVIAHELFDALPVHQFVWCADTARDVGVVQDEERGAWRERLVDVADAQDAASGLRIVRATRPTAASMAYSAWRHRLQRVGYAAPPQGEAVEEYSPSSCSLAHEMAVRVRDCGGAALVTDYGYDRAAGGNLMGATVRGIRGHQFVDMLSAPGEVDLSADVDFRSLRACAEDCNTDEAGGALPRTVRVCGPASQRTWLLNMGLGARLQRLMDGATDDGVRDRLLSEAYRLTDEGEMGSVYKFMAVTPGAADAPPAFDPLPPLA